MQNPKIKKNLEVISSNIKTIKYLFQFNKDFRFSYILALFINSFSMIRYSFIIGFPIKWVTDSVIEQDWEGLRSNLILSAIILLVNGLLTYLECYLMEISTARIGGVIRKKVLSHTILLPAAFFSRNHSADIICRLTDNVDDIEKAVSFDLVDAMNFFSLGIGSLIFIAILNFQLALICAFFSILLIFLNAFFLKPIKETSSQLKESLASSTSRYSDLLNGFFVIKMFNLDDWFMERCKAENDDLRKWSFKIGTIESLQIGINEYLSYLFSFGAIALGALFLLSGKITPGSLLALKRYSSVLTFAFIGTGKCLSALTKLLEGANRVIEVLEESPEQIGYKPTKGKKEECNSVLSFQNISFGYDEGKKLISEFSCMINKGEKVALVGPSGSGKTSLIRLINGLYSLNESQGKIFLFEEDIDEYSLAERRSYMTYMPQNSHLFMGSIRENITCGNIDVTMEEIIEAAQKANAHDFISKLADGYDSFVREDANNFSGGEKQRLAIARAFLRDSPILLLDEPVASLDSNSSVEIQKSMNLLMQDKTVLVATHKLETISGYDKVLLFDGKQILVKTKHDDPNLFNRKKES